jgi:integrase
VSLPTYTEIRYLTATEVWTLVDSAQPGSYHGIDPALYLTAAMTGMRIGGAAGARLAQRRLRACPRPRAAHMGPQDKDVHHPEVAAVRASDPDARRRRRRARPALQQRNLQADSDLVFADPLTGQPLGHRRLYERLRVALKAACLDQAHGFHSLRHSYETALAAQGVPMRTLQEWMGHRDIQTTHRYADYCPNPAERDVVEAAFARGTNPGTNLRAPVGN